VIDEKGSEERDGRSDIIDLKRMFFHMVGFVYMCIFYVENIDQNVRTTPEARNLIPAKLCCY
jgi:hypothetical protein